MSTSPKQVRFSSEIEEIYTIPGTPSPSFTVYDLSDSPNPLTPPPHNSDNSEIDDNEHVIHEVLQYTNAPPAFDFDISVDPAIGLADSTALTADVRAQSASSALFNEIYLVSRLLPWKIKILPSSTEPDAFVTVSDVLGGLFRALRLPVRLHELRAQPKDVRKEIQAAFDHRCKRYGAAEEEERLKGIKRIDFLRGHIFFRGMFVLDEKEPNVWRFSISPAPLV